MLEQVSKELRDLGFAPRIICFAGRRQAIIFDINVPTGRYKGKTLTVALSFQENAYPEYPPHFVHFKSSVRIANPMVHSSHQFEGESWSAYSLPPSDFWDKLETSKKNMTTYIKRHLLRVFARL